MKIKKTAAYLFCCLYLPFCLSACVRPDPNIGGTQPEVRPGEERVEIVDEVRLEGSER